MSTSVQGGRKLNSSEGRIFWVLYKTLGQDRDKVSFTLLELQPLENRAHITIYQSIKIIH